MADYTALVEAGNALVELLRDQMTPEPVSNRELIALCSPHESENNQLTVYLYHLEEDMQNGLSGGYYQYSQDVQKIYPAKFNLSYLITAHSKAPTHLKEADQHRLLGAAIQTIKDHPYLPEEFLKGTLENSGMRLTLSLERPTLDQLVKIWNNTSSQYKLSVICKVSGVEIESKRARAVSRVLDVQINPVQDSDPGRRNGA